MKTSYELVNMIGYEQLSVASFYSSILEVFRNTMKGRYLGRTLFKVSRVIREVGIGIVHLMIAFKTLSFANCHCSAWIWIVAERMPETLNVNLA